MQELAEAAKCDAVAMWALFDALRRVVILASPGSAQGRFVDNSHGAMPGAVRIRSSFGAAGTL